MKKVLLFCVVIISFASLNVSGQEGNWIDFADTDWFTNNQGKTYTISTAAELAGLSKLVNEGHQFKDTTIQLSDRAVIDLKVHYWTPVASGEGNSFCGTLDGNGKKISNLYIGQVTQYQNTGLFGCVGGGAKILNLSVEGGQIIGAKDWESYPSTQTGVFVATALSSGNDSIVIRNCHNLNVAVKAGYSRYTSSQDSYTGGITGYSSGKITIDQCSNNGEVTTQGDVYVGRMKIGGIAGYLNGNFIISNSFNTGNITSVYNSETYAGGVAGWVQPDNVHTSRITACYNKSAFIIIKDKNISDGVYCSGIVGGLGHDPLSSRKGGFFILDNCFSDNVFDTESVRTGAVIGDISSSRLDAVIVENSYAVDAFKNDHMYSAHAFMNIRLTNQTHTVFKVSNCLFIVDKLNDEAIPPKDFLIHNGISPLTLTLENNYMFINGIPGVSEQNLNEWSGMVNQAPVNKWNKNIWEIAAGNQYLPTLKNFSQSPAINNPLYNYSAVYHSVKLPRYSGAYYDYEPDVYKIRKGKDFIFSVSVGSREVELKNVTVKTLNETDIPVYQELSSSTYYFILKNITKDIEVVIEGEGITYQAEGSWADYADTGWFTKNPAKNKYILSTAEELAGFSKLVNEGHHFKDTTFTLGTDIDIKSHLWVPAGNSVRNNFRGIFDGNNNKIQYLSINADSQSAGLFGYLGDGAKVTNLLLEKGSIIGKRVGEQGSYPIYTGGIAGAAFSANDSIVIRNCHNINLDIDGGYDSKGREISATGGLIGFATGKTIIDSCSNTGNVNIRFNGWTKDCGVGGIVGIVRGIFTVSSSGNSGKIGPFYHNNPVQAGGIAGVAEVLNRDSSLFVSCYNNAPFAVTELLLDCGGIAGYVKDLPDNNKSGKLVVRNCYSNSIMQTGGGLIGRINMENLVSALIKDNYVITEFAELFSSKSDQYGGLIYNIYNQNTSISISNNLVIILGEYPPVYRIVSDITGPVSFLNNYAFVNGNPVEDDGKGRNGLNWGGEMSKGPVSNWNESYWVIDKSNKNMPLLKGVSNQVDIRNPLYGISEYFQLTLPRVDGIQTSYKAGTYKLLKSTDFIFKINALEGADISAMRVETGEGIPVPFLNGYYIVRNIGKNIEIVIKNVRYNGVGVEKVEKEHNVWSENNCLCVEIQQPQQMEVYTLSGQLFSSRLLPAGYTSLPVSKGIYIIRIGNETHKVVVR